MFIEPDEHIIIMEDDIYNPFNSDDLDMLYEAGIKTIIKSHVVKADHIEFGWEDERFKYILPFFYSGESFRDIVDRKEEIKKWAMECIEFLGERSQFIYAIPDGGEFLWDAVQTGNYPVSDNEIIDFIVDIQSILVQQYGEIWLCLHNFLGDPNNWNNTHLPTLYSELRHKFPETPFYSLQFAHFYCGDSPTSVKGQLKVANYARKFGVRFFVGSQYCEGLSVNLKPMLSQNAYGFVTAPLHSENPVKHKHMEHWMVDALKEANKKINDSYPLFPNSERDASSWSHLQSISE